MHRFVLRFAAVLLTAVVVGCNSNASPPSLPLFGASPPSIVATTAPTTAATVAPTTPPATVAPTTPPTTVAPTTPPATVAPTTPPATTAPTTAPTVGILTSQPSFLSFPSTISGPTACPASFYTDGFSVSESGYSGAYTAVSQNVAEVTVAPRPGYRDQFTVTASMNGPQTPTSIVVSDTLGNHLSVRIFFNTICLP